MTLSLLKVWEPPTKCESRAAHIQASQLPKLIGLFLCFEDRKVQRGRWAFKDMSPKGVKMKINGTAQIVRC